MMDLFSSEQRVSSAPVVVNAHKNELVCLAINQGGTMVATASTKGTLIRIWDTARRVQLVELRRGADQARIYCINFSCNDEWLWYSSDIFTFTRLQTQQEVSPGQFWGARGLCQVSMVAGQFYSPARVQSTM